MSRGFPNQPTLFCITDVGSTTTKAILFRRDGAWRFDRREAPTTVERPHQDVTIGVGRALSVLQEETGVQLMGDQGPVVPYLSTSSAGGGLAMVVTGLVRDVTSRSAERVALGGGAIVLDVVAMDDGRTPYEKIQALKQHRPDMVLLAGGFDGEALAGPVFLAELIRETGLKPKLSPATPMPVLYAGNQNARELVEETLGEGFLFHPVPNIRPSAERENLEPAREAIHDLFMDHVMSQAPGYERLIDWVDQPILPTPAAFAEILAHASRQLGVRILAIDIGGATTDVFTAADGEVVRTVSANLGMSYSILNVARTTGIDAILEAAPGQISAVEMWDLIGGKLIRPTRLADTPPQRTMERAVAVVAVREAVRDHLDVLRGVKLSRSTQELRIRREFVKEAAEKSFRRGGELRLKGYDLIIGSGGILSHSPRPVTARILHAALQPGDAMELAVDSAFMFPHLGALAQNQPELAVQILDEVGLVRLGSAAQWKGPAAKGGADFAGDEGSEKGGDARKAHGRVSGSDGEEERIRTGALTLRRELAVPGELFVEVGQHVETDTVVARSSREFLRAFYLDVAHALRTGPKEVHGFLLKKVGDEIEEGELVAHRKVNILKSHSYNAPVSGRIERILPNGMLVVRERRQDAQQLAAVNVAKELMVHAEQIQPYLRVEVGQEVERGQWLAAVMRAGAFRPAVSPVRGRVKEINPGYGIVTIEPLREELEVLAWLPGRVTEVTDRGCAVAAEATRFDGMWGCGGEAAGPLTLGEARTGAVVARQTIRGGQWLELAEREIAGLIVGGIHLADLVDAEPPFTVVVTEGFGERAPASELHALLAAREGDLCLLDGVTELRVGVRRPWVILPDA